MHKNGKVLARSSQPNGSIVDLFCGVGGLSHGFFLERFRIVAGIDIDESCRFPYEQNNAAPFLRKDVAKLTGRELNSLFVPDMPRILIGCAPCQPFSTYNQKHDDPKWELVSSFAGLIEDTLPEVISMENVPRLAKFRNGEVFSKFVSVLKAAGYAVSSDVLFGPDFGLAQARSRLVLLASRLGPIELPRPTHLGHYVTVRNVIGDLPPLEHGEVHEDDPLHRASRLSELNLRRLEASKPGGTWRDWDPQLRANCHRRLTGKGYGAVYGRMSWDEPSPTITTQFYGFGSGRFGHPDQRRAISLREGAMLQGFPRDYEFIHPGKTVHMSTVGRMIGNAVPVTLAQAVARAVNYHLERFT